MRTIAAVGAAVLSALAAGVARADTVFQAVGKQGIKHLNVTINGIQGDQLVFVSVGATRRVHMSEVGQIEVRASADLTEAEALRAAGEHAKAASKYETVIQAGRPAWTPVFARMRLVGVYAGTGEAEKLAKTIVDLYRTNPKEAAVVAAGDAIVSTKAADKEKAEKLIRDAMTANVGKDTSPLREVLGRLTGKVDPTLTKKDDPTAVGPTTKEPKAKVGTTPVEKTPAGTAVEQIAEDVQANIKEAGPGDIAEIDRLYKAGSFARAADVFIGLELGLTVDARQAETFYVSGGMACIKAAEKVIADIDKLRVEADRSMPQAAYKLREDAAKLMPLKKHYLTYGAIALVEALRLDGTDPKKLAEPAYWCAWAHEQLDRPLQARSIYDHFVTRFKNAAGDELFRKGKAGFDRLAQGS